MVLVKMHALRRAAGEDEVSSQHHVVRLRYLAVGEHLNLGQHVYAPLPQADSYHRKPVLTCQVRSHLNILII